MANSLNKVTTKSILDATVATADIADDAVTADKLANAINTDIAAKAVLTGSTNNTITTVTGANAIQGEANLTFDGEQLNVKHDGTTDPENQIILNGSAIDTGGGSGIFLKSSTNTTDNRYGSRIHTTRESNGASNLIFSTEITGGGTGLQEALKISPNKNVTVSDGDLVIGTAGHGIDFSANSHASGMTNELLDNYEEGSWTPDFQKDGVSNTGGSHVTGKYTRVGNLLYISAYWYKASGSNSATGGYWRCYGLPFAVEDALGGGYQFVPGGYSNINGTNYASVNNRHIRWQANASNYLAMYSNFSDANWSSSVFEMAFTGVLKIHD